MADTNTNDQKLEKYYNKIKEEAIFMFIVAILLSVFCLPVMDKYENPEKSMISCTSNVDLNNANQCGFGNCVNNMCICDPGYTTFRPNKFFNPLFRSRC